MALQTAHRGSWHVRVARAKVRGSGKGGQEARESRPRMMREGSRRPSLAPRSTIYGKRLPKLCAAAGVPAPQIPQNGGQFLQMLRRPRGGDGALVVRPESGLESRLGSATGARVLAALAAGAMSRPAIAKAGDHQRIPGAIDRAIRKLLKRGLIEPTIPHRPRSRLQEYRLTNRAAPTSVAGRADRFISAPPDLTWASDAPSWGTFRRYRLACTSTWYYTIQ